MRTKGDFNREKIAALRHFFSTIQWPSGPIEIKGYAIINDPEDYIAKNLALSGKLTDTQVSGCLKRLELIRKSLEERIIKEE